ncbi:MAG: DUF6049 family protein [Actinomycetota bacterium]|nr:DUF6049 family protein [Actinomycetota bacterium]
MTAPRRSLGVAVTTIVALFGVGSPAASAATSTTTPAAATSAPPSPAPTSSLPPSISVSPPPTPVSPTVAPPSIAGTGVAPGVATGAGAMSLISQSPFVESGQDFRLVLAVTAPTPGTRLEVVGYPRLTTRTDFDATLKGKLRQSSEYIWGPHPVSSLTADPTGGVDVAIPVNPTTGTGSAQAFTTRFDSGVYPFQVRLLDHAGDTVGAPLTTFVVYVSPAAVSAMRAPQPGTGFPRLDVALSVPVHAAPSLAGNGQPARLPPSASASASALAAVLTNHSTVPVTLDATAQTLDALGAGSSTDRATLAALGALATGGADEVAAATYASVSLPGLIGAGLGSEATSQITEGAAALMANLHRPPATGVWTVNGPLDQTTLESLTAAGVSRLVVPGSDLSAVPDAYAQTTLAAPTELATRAGPPLRVVEADAALSSHFTNGGDTVLAANQLLAELSMIQLETPGESRGVAVVPPASWTGSAPFLAVVLSGLTANPLLAPVTTTNLFSAVPLASRSSSPLQRTLTASRPNASFPDPGLIRSARAAVDAVGSIFPGDRARVATLHRQVLTSEADDLSPAQRDLAAGTVTAALAGLRRHVTLPGSSSITLTARDGGVPITVVSNGEPGAQIRLRLSSDKLSFQAFSPAGGHCSAPATGVEVCDLALGSEATTLKVPVVARTSGVFSLNVSVASRDGTVKLSDTRVTVRSTAFSGVGVILIVVAALALAYWWVRNIRHGRRARDLIPAGVDGRQTMEKAGGGVHEPAEPDPDPARPAQVRIGGGPGNGNGDRNAATPPGGDGDRSSWLDDDPVIADFFSSPPPVYPPQGPGPPRGS